MKKLNLGFTLIELLVVVSSFAVLVGGMVGLMVMITRNNRKSEALLDLRREGDNVIFSINRKIMAAAGFPEGDLCAVGDETPIAGDSVNVLIYEDSNSYSTESVNLQCDESMNENVVFNGINLLNDNLDLDLQNCSISCYNKNSVEFSFSLSNGIDEPQGFATYVVMRNAQN